MIKQQTLAALKESIRKEVENTHKWYAREQDVLICENCQIMQKMAILGALKKKNLVEISRLRSFKYFLPVR